MSYHILHQFDEQWCADNGQDDPSRQERFLDALDDVQLWPGRFSRFKTTQGRLWLIVIVSLLIAGGAVLFAIDASRKAHLLQQRVSELEATVKK